MVKSIVQALTDEQDRSRVSIMGHSMVSLHWKEERII